METQVKMPKEKFEYQESGVKSKSYKLQKTNRKRLFNDDSDISSDDETQHIDKKVKVVAEPITSQDILKTFQSKEYGKCLEMIEKLKNFKQKQTFNVNDSQFKIIQAACWTMLDVNSEQASNNLSEVIKQEPKNSFAFYGLGLHQYRQGNLEESLRSFGTAIDLNPSGAMKRAMEFKAKAKSMMDLIFDANKQFEINNFSRAMNILSAAILVDPENTKMKKNIDELRTHFLKKLIKRLECDIESDFPDKYREAEKLIMSNQLIKAEKYVNEIFNEEPKVAQSYYIKGLSLYMAGSLKDSLKHFAQALKLDNSLECANKMQEKTKTLNSFIEKAAVEMEAKEYRNAIETLSKALEVDRENRIINQASYFQRALAYFNIEQKEKAFDDFRKFELMKHLVGNVLKDIKIEPDMMEVDQANCEAEPVEIHGAKEEPKVDDTERETKAEDTEVEPKVESLEKEPQLEVYQTDKLNKALNPEDTQLKIEEQSQEIKNEASQQEQKTKEELELKAEENNVIEVSPDVKQDSPTANKNGNDFKVIKVDDSNIVVFTIPEIENLMVSAERFKTDDKPEPGYNNNSEFIVEKSEEIKTC